MLRVLKAVSPTRAAPPPEPPSAEASPVLAAAPASSPASWSTLRSQLEGRLAAAANLSPTEKIADLVPVPGQKPTSSTY